MYFHGIRASGKTTILRLLARKLKGNGYIVYFHNSPGSLPDDFSSLPKDQRIKVAVIVDEVQSDPTSTALFGLMNSKRLNLVTIGTDVPKFFKSNFTSYFQRVLSDSLLLRKGSIDMIELVPML